MFLRPRTALLLAAGVLGMLGWNRIARRSGVQDQDLARAVPGDDLIPKPHMVMDRAAVFPVAADELWPWIVQLGKERGGWYVPEWLERFTRGTMLSGIHSIDERFQQLAPGDFVPDYGPGEPLFKVMALEPPHSLVYLSLRDPAAKWTWPRQENPLPAGALALSWALVLEEIDDAQCRLYIRLRGTMEGNRFPGAMFLIGGLFDYLTIVLMFAGLRERLRERRL